MTRVLLVVWGFQTMGGMEKHVCALALGLKRAGIQVTVLSETPLPRRNRYGLELRARGIPVIAPPRRLWLLNALHLWLCRALAGKRKASQLIHGESLLSRSLKRNISTSIGTDSGLLIHVHGCRLGQTWLLDWARSRGVAAMYTEHVAIAECGGPLTHDGPRLALSAGVISCVSDHSRKSLSPLLPAGTPIAVTGHIVTAAPLVPETPRPEALRLLCPARLEAQKGVDVLLRAFAIVAPRHPMLRLTIAGGGQLRQKLIALARQLRIGDRTTFAGPLSSVAMDKALRETDVVVLPSRSEGLPLALLEAMAAAKPVIATMAGGIPEMITDNENGLLVRTGEPSEIADALERLIPNAPLRLRLGAAAHRTFTNSIHHERLVIPAMLAHYRRAQAQVHAAAPTVLVS